MEPVVNRSSKREVQINGSFGTKVCVGAVVMMVIVGIGAIRVMVATHGDKAKIDPLIAAVTLISSAIVGAILGAALALKDCIQRKIAGGEHVSVTLRLLFGSGFKSIAVWVFFVFFVGVFVLPIALTIKPF